MHYRLAWIPHDDSSASRPTSRRVCRWLCVLTSASLPSFSEDLKKQRLDFMGQDDGIAFGQMVLMGLLFVEESGQYRHSPIDLETNPPRFGLLAKAVAKLLQLEPFDGIQAATKTKRTKPKATAYRGRLFTWFISDHSRYTLREVEPSKPLNLTKDVAHGSNNHICYFSGIVDPCKMTYPKLSQLSRMGTRV